MTEIKASITGTIWKILVKVGEEVDEEETFLIMESMKMEIPHEADDDCVVKEIKVQEGDAVQEGDVLLVVEDLD